MLQRDALLDMLVPLLMTKYTNLIPHLPEVVISFCFHKITSTVFHKNGYFVSKGEICKLR